VPRHGLIHERQAAVLYFDAVDAEFQGFRIGIDRLAAAQALPVAHTVGAANESQVGAL
jgi:hypothetical protein